MNNDKYQDLITISDDRKSFREHILNKKTYFYESSDEIPADCTIQNIEVMLLVPKTVQHQFIDLIVSPGAED